MRRLLPHLLRFTAFIVLVTFLVQPMLFEPLLKPLVQANAPAIYNQGSLLSLTLSHLATVFIATFAAAVVAVGLAILVTRPVGAEFLPLSRSLVNIGQTFPPVAVLALAVPVVGFGEKPTLIALFLYGLLPIFENSMTGLSTLPPAIVEAARGTGMTARQRLTKVELPLALPVIAAGLRVAAVSNVSIVSVASLIGVSQLGSLLVDGYRRIIWGELITGILACLLLALLLDGLIVLLARAATPWRRAGGAT